MGFSLLRGLFGGPKTFKDLGLAFFVGGGGHLFKDLSEQRETGH